MTASSVVIWLWMLAAVSLVTNNLLSLQHFLGVVFLHHVNDRVQRRHLALDVGGGVFGRLEFFLKLRDSLFLLQAFIQFFLDFSLYFCLLLLQLLLEFFKF